MPTDELAQARIDNQVKTDAAGSSSIGWIEEADSIFGPPWADRESFELLEELIEDFDAALEKRRNQSLQLMEYKWPKSLWLDREELLNEIRHTLRELRE